MNRRLFAFAAILTMLLCSCGEDVVIEDETPDVVTIIEHVWHTDEIHTIEHVYHETIFVQEDTTPDVITVYEYPSGPVPCLVLFEGGVPAMADQPLSGLTVATTINDPDLMLITQGGTSKQIAFEDFPMPTNYIGGLICSYNATDPDADVDIAPGSCRDDADAANLRLASIIVKQLDAAWAVGTNQGGLDTGSIAASTLYAVWLIKRSDTGVVDVLFSTSFTSPTMPTNYDLKRLIGAIKTDGTSDIIRFLQTGDEFVYLGDSATRPPEDINDNTITNGVWETGTLSSVPPLCEGRLSAIIAESGGSAGNDLTAHLRTPPPSSWAGSTSYQISVVSDGTHSRIATPVRLIVDSSQQIDYQLVEGTGTAQIIVNVFGFRMLTRGEPQ